MEAYIHSIEPDGDSLVVMFSGCDYKCRYCNTPGLLEFKTGEVLDVKEAKRLITESGCSKVLFTGGEPLLQRAALLELASHAKAKRKRVIIDTNASKPEAIASLLDAKAVDELLVDIKAPAASFSAVTKAGTFFKSAEELYREFLETVSLLKAREEEVVITFLTLITPGLVYKKEDVLALADLLDGFDAEWHLVPFNPAVTLDSGLRGVAPPTTKFLENLASFIRKEYPNARVRVAEPRQPGKAPS